MLLLKDLEAIEEIKNADYLTITKGKDKNGIPFLKHIFELHHKIFGQTCSNCPSQLPNYINQIKNFNPKNKMENLENTTKEFQLKEGVIVPIPGTSDAYSNHNITDEIAIALLADNINRKDLFQKVPENLEELIANYEAIKLEVVTEEATPMINLSNAITPDVPAILELTEATEEVPAIDENLANQEVVEQEATQAITPEVIEVTYKKTK